jgi:hypothetical protein
MAKMALNVSTKRGVVTEAALELGGFSAGALAEFKSALVGVPFSQSAVLTASAAVPCPSLLQQRKLEELDEWIREEVPSTAHLP